jgi:hypothetical protein
VQLAKGRRGTSRNKKRLPEAFLAAAQLALLDTSETARKSPSAFGVLGFASTAGFFAQCAGGDFASSVFSDLSMAMFYLLYLASDGSGSDGGHALAWFGCQTARQKSHKGSQLSQRTRRRSHVLQVSHVVEIAIHSNHNLQPTTPSK